MGDHDVCPSCGGASMGSPQPGCEAPTANHASEERQFIRDYAAGALQAGQMVLGWHLDRLRLAVGLVEVVGPDQEIEPGTARMVPTGTDQFGQGWCVLVRDVP